MCTCICAGCKINPSFLNAQGKSPNIRGHRSVFTTKARRKQHRQQKKDRFKVSTPVWKSLREKHICTRWTERWEIYETQEVVDDQHDHEAATQDVVDQLIETTAEQTAERHNELEREYNEIAVASTTSNTVLLLPSVLIPIETPTSFSTNFHFLCTFCNISYGATVHY